MRAQLHNKIQLKVISQYSLVYFETSMPVLETVTLEGAARYDNYSTFGGETTWKLGATWNVTEEFMVRSVLATGFRAPNVCRTVWW